MQIKQIAQQRLGEVATKRITFRPGQIIAGKILKLYPNQKAHIQLGTQQMVAKLEAALSIGGNYHFQVQSTKNQMVHLKVLGNQLRTDGKLQASELLQQLGLQQTKSSTTLVQNLFDDQIPVTKRQLANVLELWNQSHNKSTALPILKEMLLNNLPMNKSTLDALVAVRSIDFTKQANKVLETLRNTDSQSISVHQKQIIEKLALLVGNSPSNVLEKNSSFLQVASLNFGERGQGTLAKENFDYQMINRLVQSLTNQSEINPNESLKQLEPIMKELSNSPLFKDVRIAQVLNSNLISQMQESNNPFLKQELLEQIRTTFDNTTNKQAIDFVQTKNQFFLHMKSFITSIGLHYEHLIANGQIEEANKTIKSVLLHFLQQQPSGKQSDSVQQLLQFINGVQLQSVKESQEFIYANLLIPSEKIQLKKDLSIEFEGKKNNAGKLDPDYCRVLFYLHLSRIEETVIDMNIQNRRVSLTIWNDYSQTKELANILKPLLSEGLNQLNYQLATVNVKPYNHMTTKKPNPKTPSPIQGVDYRI